MNKEEIKLSEQWIKEATRKTPHYKELYKHTEHELSIKHYTKADKLFLTLTIKGFVLRTPQVLY